jgi:hypothetical protein
VVGEAAWQVVTLGRADGLVLTGSSLGASLALATQVREAGVSVPLLIGGGLDAETEAEALGVADAVIVSTALKQVSGWEHIALPTDWDVTKVKTLVANVRKA